MSDTGRFTVGQRAQTTITPFLSHGHNTALAGRVTHVEGCEVLLAITHPVEWARREITFDDDLLEHLD